MTLQSAGPWAGILGGLVFLILFLLTRKRIQLGWPLVAVGAAQIVGPLATILRDRISESVGIAMSLLSIGLSVAGLVGLFVWRWKRL